MVLDLFRIIEQEQVEINTINCETVNECLQEIVGNKLNIIHFNIRSINKNFDELLIYLNQFNLKNLDIIVLSETWRIESVSDFCIPNFNAYYNESRFNKADGVIVYIKKNIICNIKLINFSETNIIRSDFKINNISFGINVSYRPPGINPDIYINELSNYLLNLNNQQIELYIGDINYDLKNGNDNNVNKYCNSLAECGWVSYINKDTRKTEYGGSILDHIFVRKENTIVLKHVNIKPLIVETSLTDHFTTMASISFQRTPSKMDKSKKFCNKINYNKLENLLKLESWEDVLNKDDVQISYDIFINKLKTYITTCTTTNLLKTNYKLKPWITNGIIESIKKRDKMKKQLLRNFTNDLKKEYTQYRNRLNKIIKFTKNQYYKNELNKVHGNYKKTWNIINEASNNNKENKQQNYAIESETGELIENKLKIANMFNNFFINVGSNMAKTINNSNIQSNTSEKKINNSMYLRPVTKEEVIIYISKLKNYSAPGPDGIQVSTIKRIHIFILEPLTHIINLSFINGNIPFEWKESIVTPIYKQGKKSQLTNYRPISVINILAKIFEQSLKNRLIEFLEKNDILNSKQYGFRKNCRTEHAILDLTKKIIYDIDSDRKSLAVFLDLAKAFDTVSHDILLTRLENVGIRGHTLKILKNYLSERKQCVKIEENKSDPLQITTGVPQGTVLGPILFLIYINNIAYINNIDGHLISYADDTVIIFTDTSWEAVYKKAEVGLDALRNFLSRSKLSLNIDKTKFLTFTATVADQPQKLDLKLHNKNCTKQNCQCPTIKKTEKIKYLGIIIDQHLKWNEHVNYINNKIRKVIHKIYLLRDILNKKNLITVYNSLVESILSYGILAWGGLYKNSLQNLQVTQNTLLKIMCHKSRLYSTTALYTDLNLLNIRSLYAYRCLLYKFNPPIEEYAHSSHPTRYQHNLNLLVPFFKKNFSQRSVFYHGAKFYNMLPINLKKNIKYNKYKVQTKIYLKNNLNEFINILE